MVGDDTIADMAVVSQPNLLPYHLQGRMKLAVVRILGRGCPLVGSWSQGVFQGQKPRVKGASTILNHQHIDKHYCWTLHWHNHQVPWYINHPGWWSYVMVGHWCPMALWRWRFNSPVDRQVLQPNFHGGQSGTEELTTLFDGLLGAGGWTGKEHC